MMLVLLLHFLAGMFAPYIYLLVKAAYNDYSQELAWRKAGYMRRIDCQASRLKLIQMVAVAAAYVIGYALIIIISLVFA